MYSNKLSWMVFFCVFFVCAKFILSTSHNTTYTKILNIKFLELGSCFIIGIESTSQSSRELISHSFHRVMVNGFEPIRARVVSCLFHKNVLNVFQGN